MSVCLFSWTQEELDFLALRDEKLARFIKLAGPVNREVIPDMFEALVFSIVGQQISSSVQARLWEKLQKAFPEVTPGCLSMASVEDLRAIGLSFRKAGYILGAARAFCEGGFCQESLERLDDEELCSRLITLRGVGRWTAEMLLIFSLQRKNVLSYGDYGIRRGLRMLHGHKEITKPLFDRYRELYSPFCSLASLYLWELASGRHEGYEDPAPARTSKRTRPRAPRTH